MPNEERAGRAAFIYEAKLRRFPDPRYPDAQLRAEALEVAERTAQPPLGPQGSNNHAMIKALNAGLILDDWSLAEEMFQRFRAGKLNELGPQYPAATVVGCMWMALYGPPEIQREAKGVIRLFFSLWRKTLISHPERIVLHSGELEPREDSRPIRRPGPKSIISIGPRSLFGPTGDPGIGWYNEAILSALYWGEQTPRTLAVQTDDLQFDNSDWGFDAPVAFNPGTYPSGDSFEDHAFKFQVDIVSFQNDSKLVVCSRDTHSTKPAVDVAEYRAGAGDLHLYSAVKYKRGYDADDPENDSQGVIVVQGGNIWAESRTEARMLQTLSRSLSNVTRQDRLTTQGVWQEIDPATQEPVDGNGEGEPPMDKAPGQDKFIACLKRWEKAERDQGGNVLDETPTREMYNVLYGKIEDGILRKFAEQIQKLAAKADVPGVSDDD